MGHTGEFFSNDIHVLDVEFSLTLPPILIAYADFSPAVSAIVLSPETSWDPLNDALPSVASTRCIISKGYSAKIVPLSDSPIVVDEPLHVVSP